MINTVLMMIVMTNGGHRKTTPRFLLFTKWHGMGLLSNVKASEKIKNENPSDKGKRLSKLNLNFK